MALPLRWRVACAVSSLLTVAMLATPADGAPVINVVTLTDLASDTTPIANFGQADIFATTAAYKPAEITFTAKTSIPENPSETPNWNTPSTGIDFLIRTTAAAPDYNFVIHYFAVNGKINAAVFAANDANRENALCQATMATYSGKTHRVTIDPACIGKPESFTFALNKPIVGMASNPAGTGYWFVASDGGIFAFGDAKFFGSTGAMKLNKPIVGMAPTPTGQGYYLVASDGGIFSFGDARFRGSTGAIKLNKPIVGMAVAPNGRGYWLVASDGGVFAFGNGARFFGSTGDIKLVQPIIGIAPTNSNDGYWFVAADGGIFSFGDARSFTPTLGGAPVTGLAKSPDGDGLWVARANGQVNGYGSVPSLGSLASAPAFPIVGIAPLEIPDPVPAA
jgi:ribosomal protein L24E